MNWFKSFFHLYPEKHRIVFLYERYEIQTDDGTGGRKWKEIETRAYLGSVCVWTASYKSRYDNFDDAIDVCDMLNKPKEKPIPKIVYQPK